MSQKPCRGNVVFKTMDSTLWLYSLYSTSFDFKMVLRYSFILRDCVRLLI